MTRPLSFELEINFPDQSPHNIPLENKLSLGSTDVSELCIEDYGLAPMHLSFRVHNGILSLHNLGGTYPTHLGEQKLNHGKMYLLNIGDIIKCGEVQIKILEGSIEQTPPAPATEQTEPENIDDTFEEMKVTEEQQAPIDEAPTPDELSDTIFEDETDPSFQFDSMTEEQIQESEEDDDEDHSFLEGVKGSTLIERLKTRFLKRDFSEDPRKIEIKKSAATIVKVSPPGPFLRLFALVINASITYTLVFEFLKDSSVATHFSAAYNKLLPLIKEVPYSHHITESLFSIILTFIALDLISSLIFGVNIGQLLVGIKSSRGVLISRIQAILRSLISVVTTPLLIFDAPCVIGKRTLKEFITGSALTSRSKIFSIISFILILPIFILLPFVSPVILNLSEFDNYTVNESLNVKVPKEFRATKVWPLKPMKLKFSGKWNENFRVIPSPSVKENQSSLEIISLNEKLVSTSIKLQQTQSLSKIFPKLATINPVFKYQYQHLYKTLTSKKDLNLSKESIADIQSLVLNSLSMNLEKAPALLIEHGPFVKDLIFVNSFLKDKVSLTSKSSIEFYTSDKKFLLFVTNSTRKKQVINILMVNQLGEMNVYKSISNKVHASDHLSVTKLLFQNALIVKDSDTASSWDSAKMLELYSDLHSSKRDLKDIEIASSYEYYFELARKLVQLSTKSDSYAAHIDFLTKQIQSTNIFLEELIEFKQLRGVEELHSSLKKLSFALNEKNLSFFSL
ncbi:FHA domain-containing protein [Halobacteriovorax sp. HLS]|uniref:FHA domain-containing protein n=1 Tax=Halobacteriovorax sp. HLS TaxID=2234000 RepID=UPI000FD7B0E3|nr:FHA domain-containing protein [Halobacteriovorax sp. HLS]